MRNKYIKLWENFEVDDEFWDNLDNNDTEEMKEVQREIDRKEKEETFNRKERHKRNISASGKTWKEAVLLRVKSTKDAFTNIINSSNEEMAREYAIEAYEHISSLREMGFEAVEYADNLEEELKKLNIKYLSVVNRIL